MKARLLSGLQYPPVKEEGALLIVKCSRGLVRRTIPKDQVSLWPCGPSTESTDHGLELQMDVNIFAIVFVQGVSE